MVWETRGPNRFYYRVRRVGGGVTKQCFKAGTEARAAAREDAQRRKAMLDDNRSARVLADTMRPLDTLLDRVDESVDRLIITPTIMAISTAIDLPGRDSLRSVA